MGINKVKNYLNKIILRSGIRRLFPWFNIFYFFLLSTVAFAATSWLLKDLGFISLAYGAVGVFALLSVFLFMAALNKQAIRKMYLNFVNVYSGFYDLEQNEINALSRTSEYMQEPLKTILKKWTTRYKTSNMSVEDCLEGILTEIGDKEFRKFIKFTKVNVKYGGDYKKALNKLKEQGERLQSVYSMKASTAVIGTMVILLMIIINLILVRSAMSDPVVLRTLKTTEQGVLILGGNAAAIIIGMLMIFSINKD